MSGAKAVDRSCAMGATQALAPKFPGLLLSYPSSGVAQVSISSEPANALSLALWQSLLRVLKFLESNGSTKVLLISSGLRKDIFSAGNDISELHAPSTSEERFTDFWTTSTCFLASLYGSPLYTIAALRGACPAGGCAIALCCDERIALNSGAFRMGLNEAALGIPVPLYWARLMLLTGTQRVRIEGMLKTGQMVGAADALSLGLVDLVVYGPPERLDDRAKQAASTASLRLQKAGNAGFRLTKDSIRGEFAKQWASYASEEARNSWALLRTETVSSQLGRVLKMLRAGSQTNQRDAKL